MSKIPLTFPRKYAAIPVLAITFLALYPQLMLLISKGSSWHGSYVVSNYDEAAYSAYINALSSGSPRQSDPFLAIDDTGAESLYSIQFIPAYMIAVPARILGVSTSTAFIFLTIVSAILSSLAVFWFIHLVTQNRMLAMSGTLIVLCLGTAVAFQGELSRLLGGGVLIDFLPFLRRYQPALAFPLFFVFCGLVWKSYTSGEMRRSLIIATGAGLILGLLIFSYFYLWTAAAAWFACFSLLHLVVFREERKRVALACITIVVLAAVELVPYFWMLASRSPNLDSVQLLTATRLPDLLAPPLILGLILAAAIAVMIFRGRIS